MSLLLYTYCVPIANETVKPQRTAGLTIGDSCQVTGLGSLSNGFV